MDYNTNHHPNNYDCANYHEINLLIRTVSDAKVDVYLPETKKINKNKSRVLEHALD